MRAVLGTAVLLAIVGRAAALATSSPLTGVRTSRVGVAPSWEGGLAHSATRPTSPSERQLLAPFLASFRGHFDNFAQVLEDRAADLAPRHGGGHEHIHCHVQPIEPLAAAEEDFVLASYYFDNDPKKLFRERVYGMRELEADQQFGHCIQMRIFRLRASTEEALRGVGSAAAVDCWSAADVDTELLLPGCDVFWRPVGDRFEGRMRTESVVVESPTMGIPIVVRDDVTLGSDALWINDRGSDVAGNYLYGNVRDVPYKLDRMPEVQHDMEDFESWLSGC